MGLTDFILLGASTFHIRSLSGLLAPVPLILFLKMCVYGRQQTTVQMLGRYPSGGRTWQSFLFPYFGLQRLKVWFKMLSSWDWLLQHSSNHFIVLSAIHEFDGLRNFRLIVTQDQHIDTKLKQATLSILLTHKSLPTWTSKWNIK